MKPRVRGWLSRLAGAFGRGRSDQDLAQELQLHLELAEEDFRRQGMPPEMAAREARVQAGQSTHAMETLRARRGIPALGAFWLDAKMGLRMLRKHWGLTLMGALTLSAAMTIGAAVFNLVGAIRGRTLPFEDGDRVVIIQPFNPATRRLENSSREDFERWRAELRSVENVGAFRTVERNLMVASGLPAPVAVAEMSASGFVVPRIAPLLGRPLLPEDEAVTAAPVIVIGYDVWRVKFSANPDVLGQQVRLDGVSHTVVGVMPKAFAFPVNHQYWVSLRTNAKDRVVVFARLAPGASVASAHADVQTKGLREMTETTDTGRTVQARLVPYVAGIGFSSDSGGAMMAILPFVLPLLLIPPCANLAILIYARTVARQGEFAARSALGASRGRIVAQILIEVSLLTAAAAVLALLVSSKVGVLFQSLFAIGDRPFWMDFDLSYRTIFFAGGLALLAAMIAGGIPALRATGRWRQAGSHAFRDGAPPRLGRVWTVIVVAQVALSVAVAPTVAEVAWDTMRPAILGPGFHARDFVAARLVMNRAAGSDAAAVRFHAARAAVVRQLAAEPGISAVTMTEAAPFEEPGVVIEVDGRRDPQSVSLNHVDHAFFDALGIPLLTGRRLGGGDAGAVVVNRSFARRILGDGNPLGRRIRVAGQKPNPISGAAPEYEVVGVVGDLFAESRIPTMYRPLPDRLDPSAQQEVYQVCIVMRAGPTTPTNLAGRVREITAALDPALRVDEVQPLDEVYRLSSIGNLAGGSILAGLTLCVVLFSVAGIYTSMAFTVVQRRREIGIRSALGAAPWKLVAGIFRQVLVPVAAGAAVGGVAAMLLDFYLAPLLFDIARDGRPLPWILPAAEAFLVLVAVSALHGPVRRALRVDPIEALRES